MSIASAIQSAQTKIAAAYTACDNKGATMPSSANQNLSNLAGTIDSISTGSTPNLTPLSVTPTTSAQRITPTSPVDGYDEVNVAAVTSAIDTNITAGNIKNGVSILGVTGTCGRNFISGTFTARSTAGTQTITLPYTGSGYPIAAMIFPSGGTKENTTWYNLVQRYAVGVWTMHKSAMSSTPSYSASGDADAGHVLSLYKNSTSSATTYARVGSASASCYSSANAESSGYACVKFKSATTMSVYVHTTSYGLAAGLEYTYMIIYSE